MSGIDNLGRKLWHAVMKEAEPTTAPSAPAAPSAPSSSSMRSASTPAPAQPAVTPGPQTFPLKGDAGLQRVAAGQTLAAGAKGDSVEKFQEALLHAGGRLPRYGADGWFGAETSAALKRFQAQSKLPATGVLDAKTLAALDEAAKKGLKYPEYARLFADGVLRTTLAIGYDEVGSHQPELREVSAGLATRGYQQVDPRTLDAGERTRLGITDDDATWFTRRLTHDGQEVTSVVRLVTPRTPNAQREFTQGLERDELVLYGGHGRYGSGPDFDDIGSPDGNFVIGAPSSPGHVTLGESSLQKAHLTNEYQLMFFDACNTFRYMDDLRSVPKNKGTKNLDLVGSTTELYWHNTAENVLSMLDAVTSGKSIDEARADLDALNREGPADTRRYFMTDGFDDNR